MIQCCPSRTRFGEFEPDHIVVALRPGEEAGWQEQGLLDELRERFGLPTTVFVARPG